ncbi:2-keto-4-pentenoate hydratase [Methylobacterium frigidaeris]|uniref:2-keto-4-pentenoate hydratase n=1 Tax=Methylobacterium frigidaeris TaxID=2038277 RepID=A0AA37M8N5_9HYPH|nr:fumarylacetoacetate hydrolase family protein [Methylobacterium frigidaeris]PIK70303.1 2-keto-4-pentenoate hydratase [Methylobacterium frigidaeris]GJD67013.1 2-keto-4-pentenoate hydratase [Methylobacterium frigidaeris]
MPFSIDAAAAALLDARRTRTRLDALPEGARPESEAEAYAVQDAVARALGPVAGWKVGAPSATANPARAALHADTIFASDAGSCTLPASLFHVIGAEAEIAYRFARDLPPEAGPYDRDAVLAAIATMHPAIEIADTRFATFGAVDAPSQRADQQNHGVLVLGPGLTAWRGLDPVAQPVRLTVDGTVLHDRVGGNSAVDPVRLLVWLANEGARSLGGIKAGQVVTTGSCTGTDFVTAPTRMAADFPGLGSVTLAIA